jgi:uncharacterized lipoprotein YajG
VDGDEITLGDHPMHLDVDRPDRGKVILDCLQAFAAWASCWTQSSTIRSSNASVSPTRKASKSRATAWLVPLRVCHRFLLVIRSG